MNRAKEIKNWNQGGNSYVLKGNPRNRWVGFQESVIVQLTENFGDDFNIVIWVEEEDEHDYYAIPFSELRHLFTPEHKTSGKYPDRWTAIIVGHLFMPHGNKTLSVDVSRFYGRPLMVSEGIKVDDDYFIENAKAEINIRLGQSKFRKGVLKNFQHKCALTEVSESNLLVASHIVPWSADKTTRGDIANGLCLCAELDGYFDKGYFSLTDDLEIILPTTVSSFSSPLQKRLKEIAGKRLTKPKRPINTDYLRFHRENILLK
jgi:putative restriction endonuclease